MRWATNGVVHRCSRANKSEFNNKMFCAAGNILAVVKPIFHRLFIIIIVDIVLSSEVKMKKSTSLF